MPLKATLRHRIAISLTVVAVVACVSTPSRVERWAIRVVATDGRFVGGVVLELTAQPSSKSCAGVPGMMVARIVEKHGFAHDYVRDEAAVYLANGKLYADLSVGVCDHTLTISGTVTGRRAAGEASRSTLVGAMKVGRFIAEKR